MAGFSGSNGGIGKIYRQFLVEDINFAIKKYQVLYDCIPENEKIKEDYKGFLENLQGLKRGLETKIEIGG